MMRMTRLSLAFLAIVTVSMPVLAQADSLFVEGVRYAKPYRILTSGKQVTIKSTKDIRNVMVWTSGGHRIVESKDINNSSYTFRVVVNDKVVFAMVQLTDGKVYSEKIGLP